MFNLVFCRPQHGKQCNVIICMWWSQCLGPLHCQFYSLSLVLVGVYVAVILTQSSSYLCIYAGQWIFEKAVETNNLIIMGHFPKMIFVGCAPGLWIAVTRMECNCQKSTSTAHPPSPEHGQNLCFLCLLPFLTWWGRCVRVVQGPDSCLESFSCSPGTAMGSHELSVNSGLLGNLVFKVSAEIHVSLFTFTWIRHCPHKTWLEFSSQPQSSWPSPH